MTRKEKSKIICEHLRKDSLVDGVSETYLIASVMDALKEIEAKELNIPVINPNYDYDDDDEDYDNNGPRNLQLNGLFFKCTYHSSPEQYDVFTAAGEQVGYVRLRYGNLYAEYPDCGGTLVYDTAAFAGDGYFRDDRERLYHLENIADALMTKEMEKWRKRESESLEEVRE